MDALPQEGPKSTYSTGGNTWNQSVSPNGGAKSAQYNLIISFLRVAEALRGGARDGSSWLINQARLALVGAAAALAVAPQWCPWVLAFVGAAGAPAAALCARSWVLA